MEETLHGSTGRNRNRKERRRGRGEGKEGEREKQRREGEEISEEEIRNAIKNLKCGKAAGGDGITNEAWKWGEKEIVQDLKDVPNRIWNREAIPEEWEKGIVVLVFK